jgi:hypothetical protein
VDFVLIIIFPFVFFLELSGDSEEEETVVLNAVDMNLSNKNTEDNGTSKKKPEKNVRNWYPMHQW